MDLGSINEKLLLNVQRAQIEQIALVSKSLGLKIGSQFLAQVEKITQATPAERAEIIKAIDNTLAQLNKNSAAPATQALIQQLVAQKELLQEPGVKLASINVNPVQLSGSPITNNTLAASNGISQSLLTYTNQGLQTGQTLLLQLTETGRLQVLQPLNQAQIDTLVKLIQAQGINSNQKPIIAPNTYEKDASIESQSPKSINAQLAALDAGAKLDVAKLLAQSGNTASPKTLAPGTDNIRAAISESLRQLLPKKDSGQDILASLPKLMQFIQQLPLSQRREWLPNSLQDALKTLSNHIRQSDQLSNTRQLAMALHNNGQTFENKLMQQLQATTISTSPLSASVAGKPNITTGLNTGNPLAPTEKLALLNATQTQIGKPAANPIEKIIAQDLKASLLSLRQQLETEIASSSSTPLASPEITKNPAMAALPLFLNLMMNKQQGELSQKQLRTQLIMLMHQYTLGSLAKIQLQQIHSLNQQLTQTDVTQPNQSWQFELPVRQGQDVQPLHIHIEQQWIEEQQPKDSPTTTRVRQWNVMLNFNLPVVGKFYAQLGLLGDNLSATFWAEHEHTLAEAKHKIDGLTQQLEQQGIKVTQMQCMPGLPPTPKMLLSYALVDVKT